ncbi:phosphate ABC transporter permease subunit PstC, partial [Chromobacterium piscinae]
MQKLNNQQQLGHQLLLDKIFRVTTRSFAFLVLALLVGILLSLL